MSHRFQALAIVAGMCLALAVSVHAAQAKSQPPQRPTPTLSPTCPICVTVTPVPAAAACSNSGPAGIHPSILARVIVGFNPIGVYPSPKGDLIYVANSTSNSLSKILTANWKVLSNLQVSDGPAWIAMLPGSEQLVVTSRNARVLNLINGEKNYLIATIDLNIAPEQVVVDLQGKYAYISCNDSTNLTVVDLLLRRRAKTIALNGTSSGLAMSTDGKTIYALTNGAYYNLQVVSTELQTVVARAGLGSAPAGVAMAHQAPYAYVANHDSNDLSVVYRPDHHPALTIPVDDGPVAVAVAPSDRYVFVSCQLSNSVVVVDTQQNQVVDRIKLEFSPLGIAVSPDGTTLYVASYQVRSTTNVSTDIYRPQTNLASGATSQSNNNILLVLSTGCYR